MAKIPVAQIGGITHASNAVPMSGTVGAGFGMEDAAAAVQLGNAIANPGEKIAAAGAHAVSAINQFYIAKQRDEDTLLAAQDRNLFSSIQNELDGWLSANPNASDDDKRAKIEEAEKNYTSGRTQFTDKMSEKFRNFHDEEMRGIAGNANSRRIALLNQGAVVRLRNQRQSAVDEALKMGNTEEAKRIITEGRGSSFSDEEAQSMLADIPRLEEYYRARQSLALGEWNVLEQLEQVRKGDKSGGWNALRPDDLDKLVGYGRAFRRESEEKTYDSALAVLAQNQRPYTDRELEDLHTSGRMSDKQFATLKKWCTEFDRSQERAQNTAQSQKENLAKGRRQQFIDWTLTTQVFTPSGEFIPQSEADWYRILASVRNECGEAYGMYNDFLNKVRSLRKEQNSMRSEAANNSPEAIARRMGREEIYRKVGEWFKENELYYAPEKGKERFGKELRQYVEMLTYGNQLLDAGEDWNTISKKLEERKFLLNEGEIRSVLAGAPAEPDKMPSADETAVEVERRTMPNGEVWAKLSNGKIVKVK